MATDEELLRNHLIARIIENIPREMLEEFQRRAQATYTGKFADVRTDPTTLEEHRLPKLIQDRMFRMEWELAETAKAYGLPYSSKMLSENKWTYTYVICGGIGITQAYVPTVGARPIPAKYRDKLAEKAGVPRLPIDDPAEIYQAKEFYALLAHNPVGRHFSEEHQKLGALQLCVPCEDMNKWALEIGVQELLSLYPAKTGKGKKSAERDPLWISKPKRETGTE